MVNIPIEKDPNKVDIYDLGFDKTLNRPTEESPQTQSVYDTFKDISSTNLFQLGNLPPQIFVPSGSIICYGGSTAPNGWLLCDGTAYSRQTYNALFGVISTTFGTGDGSTTFNVPDLRGRGPMGKDTGTFATLGGTGGEETHTLTTAQMPTHTHAIDTWNAAGTGGFVQASNNSSQLADAVTESTGGGAAHNVLDPYLVVQFIIKF